MRRLVAVALLISTSVFAETTTKSSAQTAESTQTQEAPAQKWPSLDNMWNKTDGGESLKRAIVDGTLSAEVLLGYEYSNLSDNGNDAAHALLTRTTINYLTGNFHGFDSFIQAQYVGPLNNNYYDGTGANPGKDTVADPENFRFHQVYLAYTGYDSVARVGSQEIILDNARFIGDIGWRLNQQSFNAGSIKNQSVENLKLFYAYAASINDILGETSQNRQYHMLNAEYKIGEKNQASAFAYLQRNDRGGLDKLDTYGGRFWGKSDVLAYDLIGSLQRSAYYAFLKVNMDLERFNVGAGAEYISGGGGNQNFQTLNGTAHKFNGWADQFLGTGGGLPSGLVDLWGEGSITVAEKLKLMGVYHFFNTAYNTAPASFSGVYGHEFDFLAKYPVHKNFDVLAKLAYYIKSDNAASNFTRDETVFWLRGTLRF